MSDAIEAVETVAQRVWRFVPPGHWLYAILDAAREPEIVNQLCALRPEFDSLYRGRAEQTLWEVAPYLVRLDEGSEFSEWLFKEGWGKAWGILALSSADLIQLHRHFRRFLMVKGPRGENLYFRYYDPRVLRDYIPTCNRQETATVFGPIATYLIEGAEPGVIMQVLPGTEKVEVGSFGPGDEPPQLGTEATSGAATQRASGTPSPSPSDTLRENPSATLEQPVGRIQRVTLEVKQAGGQGRRVWLRPGQVLTVGRTDESDFAVPLDAYLSGVHFSLQCEHSNCRLRALSTRSGTYLNGERVTEAQLRDRDEIVAGQTTFAVTVEGDPSLSYRPDRPATGKTATGTAPTAGTSTGSGVMASIEVTAGPYDGLTADLPTGKPLVIGRLPEQGLSLPNDSSISRRHCQIEFVPPDCQLTDLGSSYGTLVNGQKVIDAKLRNGETFQAGTSEFKTHIGSALAPARTLRIRKEQMDKLAGPKKADFKTRLMRHLDEILPAKGIKMSSESLARQIDEAIKRSKHYRVHRECDVAQYVEIVVLYLDGFTEQGHPVEARNILYDHRLTPEEKLAKLQQWAEGASRSKASPGKPVESGVSAAR
jgi:pSer/pThr/pTyr-binding forkhead associated (FHA) protein